MTWKRRRPLVYSSPLTSFHDQLLFLSTHSTLCLEDNRVVGSESGELETGISNKPDAENGDQPVMSKILLNADPSPLGQLHFVFINLPELAFSWVYYFLVLLLSLHNNILCDQCSDEEVALQCREIVLANLLLLPSVSA